MMKGDMGVLSEEGKGSTFWFTFEVRSTTISPSQSNENSNEIILTNFFHEFYPKILLVDDNVVNRKVASEIMQKAGCEVFTAESGMEAIQKFEADSDFDLIFMDIQMPEMDGVETMKRMRQQFGKKLPKIVAMTAYSMQHDRERFLREGMDDYVPKPIRAQILIQKVRDLIDTESVKIKRKNSISEKFSEEKTSTKNDNFFTTEDNTISLPVHSSKNNYIAATIPVFDMEVVNQLKEMVGEETLLSVYEDFEREAEEQIVSAKNAFKENNVKTIQQELHTLKGNSGTIGLMRIHEIVEKIEVPSKIGDLTNFEEKVLILENEFSVFKEKIKSLIG